MVKWDTNENILEWSSEEIVIPYRSPKTGRIHRYFPDFYIKYTDSSGQIQRALLEIKPKAQTVPPTPPKRITNAFIQKAITWEVNVAKWEAARNWCERNDARFEILTEDTIKGFKK